MFKNQEHPNPDLLEELQKSIGCQYLSDLHDPAHRMTLAKAILRIPAARYDLEAWVDAAQYMIGVELGCFNAVEARTEIIAKLSETH